MSPSVGSRSTSASRGASTARGPTIPGQQVEPLGAEVELDRTVQVADQELVLTAGHGLHAAGQVGPQLQPGAPAGPLDQPAQGAAVRQRAEVERLAPAV